MSEDNIVYKCTVLTGRLPAPKVRYWIEERKDGAYIVCEFSTLGPMSRVDADRFMLRFG